MAGLRRSLLFSVGMFGLKHKRVIVATLIREGRRAAGVAKIKMAFKTTTLPTHSRRGKDFLSVPVISLTSSGFNTVFTAY